MKKVRKVLTDKAIQALKPAPAGKRYLIGDAVVPGLAVMLLALCANLAGDGIRDLLARR